VKGFEFDILFVAIAGVLTVNGSGALSVDRLITSSRPVRVKQSSLQAKLAY